MNINTFKYFLLDAIKGLKRNATITIFSVVTISITLFIFGLFLLYLLSVRGSLETISTTNSAAKEMIILLRYFEVAIFIVLPVISLLLTINSFKIALYSRKNDINVMKLIGATDWFIGWPYIIQGLIIGISGAIIGNALLFFIYRFLYAKAMAFEPELSIVQPTFVIQLLLCPFAIVGAFMGFIGSCMALRKILK